MSKQCSIPNCVKKAAGRGWCHAHYRRWRKNGSPTAVKRPSGPMGKGERFDLQYIAVPESGCWLWTGTLSINGYGQFGDNYRTRGAHRVSYEMHKGPIPPGAYILHKCDVKSCVNPEHLYAGSAQDNRDDAERRNRVRHLYGSEHPSTKLTDQEVLVIAASEEPGRTLAARYKVCPATISEIQTGRKRSHVTGRVYAGTERGG